MDFSHHAGVSYGVTTLGARGQIVIPSKARKDLDLKKGDRLLVFSRYGKFLGLIKDEAIDEFISYATEKMAKGIKEFKKWKTSPK